MRQGLSQDLIKPILGKESCIRWINWNKGFLSVICKMVPMLHLLFIILSIEQNNSKRIRKDFIIWSQTLDKKRYFFDELFVKNHNFDYNKVALQKKILYTFDSSDTKDEWWNKIVQIVTELNIKNGDLAMNLRVAITGITKFNIIYFFSFYSLVFIGLINEKK